MKRVLVCFAVKQEAAPFKPSKGVFMLLTGMGEFNVRRVLPEVLESSRPDVVLTCGFAGALNPILPIGTVLGETFDPSLAKILEAAKIQLRRFHCSDRIAITASEKNALFTETGCDAVEMESGIIHRICRENRIPCATVRAISDTASEDLPLDFNRLLDFRHRLSPWRLTRAILCQPSSILKLLRLGQRSNLAAKNLARSLTLIGLSNRASQRYLR